MNARNWPLIAGWTAVTISTLLSALWAAWGIIETFHEGWYYPTLAGNLALTLGQYLSPMLIFIALALAAITWPRAGGVLHGLLALLALGFFAAASNAATLLLILPLLLLGVLYWLGRPAPRKLAAALAVAVPLIVLLVAGFAPARRVAARVDDGDRGARRVAGNGVTLTWAPQGPGWPEGGASWHEAGKVCAFLAADGRTLAATRQDIWRLPTVEEAVRSMALHGRNSGGAWDAAAARASYEMPPDKEAPLWDTHSPVIYWWTATAVDDARAYMIAYDGQVWPRRQSQRMGSLGFRCVRE